MKERIVRGLSWGTTALCAVYILWGCYVISRQVPTMAQLFAGLGTELPRSTRFVLKVSELYLWPMGFLLALGVVGKERLRDPLIRLAITFGIFISAVWFFHFAFTAMMEPLVGILKKIG